MKTLPLKLVLEDASALAEVARVIEQGGLVCAPCTGAYRILADLNNEDAVSRLLQSKRRTGRAPSLVFVADAAMLGQVAAEISPLARRLVKAMWPGPLTILFEPHAELPAAVVKQLCKSSGKIGVRVPADPLAQALVRGLCRPVLVSSANREKKAGAGSAAQVRKNFLGRVDLFVDAGDLKSSPASTVVDLVDGQPVVTRPGAVSEADIQQAARG
ncbi:MAG TPA: L-threonylcarbamoyladenylate synthase [Myxococcota bacterium]|nr:L-threonylcarbamoyladenylate synthase [Myxococcota bacterium]HRY95719.1 L-threonylcarbamoyladenylate synthase [Myxococcota bacterium]HSA21030.1 L-threonylcarbamoyladenylate synthase [Myxococcota bacterium]